MSSITATPPVQLAQPSGVEMNAYLILEKKPIRQDIKLKTLSKYVQQYPTGWKKRLELAELLYAMGRWEQAVKEYRQVIERQPQFIDVRLQLGKILQSLGREAEAIEVYESARDLISNVAIAHHINGLIEACRRRLQQATQLFERAASMEPENIFHWLALGLTHLEAEAPVEALRAFDAVLELNPTDIVALSHSYEALMMVGDFQEAQQRLRQVLEVFPHDLRSLKQLADHRSRMGLVWGEEGKQTKQMIQTAQRIAPGAAYAYDSLAQYHIFRGEWKQGVAVLQQFVEQRPLNPSGWYYYAWCLFYTGNSTAAAEAILKAYALYPKDWEIYRALCEILPEAGRLERLQPVVEEMLERFPERWSVWATAGQVLVECFQDKEWGCTVSAKGTQLQPRLADAWFRHGQVLALAGRHWEAVIALEQGWRRLPQQGGYLQAVPAAVSLGESYRVLGEEAKSRRWWGEAFERAKELMDFNRAIAHYWQGRALEGLGDVTGACCAYRIALSRQLLYPARGEVKEALKQL
ncbi:MAG TPA: tetratricopeptide repeat protein [Stenomitos sp.]